MSSTTGTETLLHDLLHAQADAVDVAIPRPPVEQLADVVSITDRRRRTRRTVATVITIAATIALIVGVLAIRPSGSPRTTAATGAGMDVVNVGPPVVQFDFPRTPSGFHSVTSHTALWLPPATCVAWTINGPQLRCSNLVGTTSNSYANGSTRIDVVSGRLAGVGDFAPGLASGEHALVPRPRGRAPVHRGEAGLYEDVDTTKPPVAGSTVHALVSWTESDGTTVVVTLNEPAGSEWPRTRVLDLANRVVPTRNAPRTVGLAIGAVHSVAQGSDISDPWSVFGPSAAPCIMPGAGDCMPLGLR